MSIIKHPSPSIKPTNHLASGIPMKENTGLGIGVIFGKVFSSSSLIPLL